MSLTILLLTTELNESGSCSGVAFDVATECVLYFGCAVQETPSALGMFHVMRYINVRYLLTYILTLCRRKSKFLMKIKYKTTSNLLYHAVQKVASDELAELQKLMQ